MVLCLRRSNWWPTTDLFGHDLHEPNPLTWVEEENESESESEEEGQEGLEEATM